MGSNQDIGVANGLYATPKNIVIENCKKTISKMEQEIAELERIKITLAVGTKEYFECEKRIARRNEIINTCERTIPLMESQMNLPTYKSFRGL